MSDFEDDELPEIPEITINKSASPSQFSMPDADVLATQRAKDAAIDKKVREALECLATDSTNANEVGKWTLSTAINSLQIAKQPTTSPADILEVLITHLQCNDKEFLTEFLVCLKEADVAVDRVADCFLDSVSELLQYNSDWSDDEVLNVCVACVSVSMGGTQDAGRSKKLLLHILENVASKEQVDTFTAVLVASLPAIEPPVRMRLVGALRGMRVSKRASCEVGSAALRLILKADDQSGTKRLTARTVLPLIKTTWRSLSAKDKYQTIQLLGRVLDRDCDNTEEATREKLLAGLANTAIKGANKNHLPELKVLVAAKKLRLLLRKKR